MRFASPTSSGGEACRGSELRDWRLCGLALLVGLSLYGQPSRPTSAQPADTAPTTEPSQTRTDDLPSFSRAVGELNTDLNEARYRNLHAVVVMQDGQVNLERYFAGSDNRWGQPLGHVQFKRETKHDLRSVSKSVTSLLVGIALGSDFEAKLRQPLVDYLPNLESRRADLRNITLHHVLTMTAGLEWNESDLPYTDPRNDGIRFLRSPDPIRYVLRRPIRDTPGKRWNYNGGLTMVLGKVVEQLTGRQLDDYAREVLFQPLGISDFDWLGNPTWQQRMPSADSGLRMRAIDVAKIGVLLAQEGQWQGRQLVPRTWLEMSMSPQAEVPHWIYDYGLHWWLREVKTEASRLKVVGAIGRGGQLLMVVPARRLVLVTLAGRYDDASRPFDGERILLKLLRATGE